MMGVQPGIAPERRVLSSQVNYVEVNAKTIHYYNIIISDTIPRVLLEICFRRFSGTDLFRASPYPSGSP